MTTVDKHVRRGGHTDAGLLATIEVRLFKHIDWDPDAVASGEIVPGPVGGAEVTVDREDMFLSRSQVVSEAIKQLLGDLASAARAEGRDD